MEFEGKNVEKNLQNEQKIEKNNSKNSNFTKNQDDKHIIKNSTFASQLSLDNDFNSKKDVKTIQNNINFTETVEENVKNSQEFLENLFKTASIDAEIEKIETDKAIILKIKTENEDVLIGKNAEVLNSLQQLIKNFIKPTSKLGKRILIDIGNYREQKEQELITKTKNAIEKCLQTARPITLDFMNAYERFIVHEIVLSDGRVVSESYGKEPRRFVKIFIK